MMSKSGPCASGKSVRDGLSDLDAALKASRELGSPDVEQAAVHGVHEEAERRPLGWRELYARPLKGVVVQMVIELRVTSM